MTRVWNVAMVVGCLLVAGPVSAQQRPLFVEDPEPIGAGRVLVEGGFETARAQQYPASGLEGRLFRLPFGLSVGISSIAELQIDTSLYDSLSISQRTAAPLSQLVTATGNRTSDTGDIAIGTKIRLLAEGVGHPAVAFRFSTKLPNASNESGLGLDTTEFYSSLLVAKTVQSIRVVANGGFGILPDPVVGYRQNDVITYGLSLARAVTDASELVAEANGRVSTRSGTAFPGTETRGQVALGGRYTRGAVRLDARIFFGLQDVDPRIGAGAGFTYVFNAFKLP